MHKLELASGPLFLYAYGIPLDIALIFFMSRPLLDDVFRVQDNFGHWGLLAQWVRTVS